MSQQQHSTTEAGEIVMVEKNGGLFALGGLGAAGLIGAIFIGVVASAESNSGTPGR